MKNLLGSLWPRNVCPAGLAAALCMMAAQSAVAGAAGSLPAGIQAALADRIPSQAEKARITDSLSGALQSGVDGDRLAAVVKRSLERGVSTEGLSRMIGILAAARRSGLPTGPHTGKILEGLAKGVDENRILSALRKVNGRLQFATRLASGGGPDVRTSEVLVVRTADALAAGMDREGLEDLFDVMRREKVNDNLAPEDIMEMVKAASGYGVDPDAVREYAVSLMKSRDADLDDVRRYLDGLSEGPFDDGGGDSGPDTQEDSAAGPGDEDQDEEDDQGYGEEDGSDEEDGYGEEGSGEDERDGSDSEDDGEEREQGEDEED